MAALTGADCGGVRLLSDPARPAGPCRLFFWRREQEYAWRDLDNLPGSNTVRVLETGRGEYSPDLAAMAAASDPSASIAVARDGLHSSLIVPLHAAGRAVGTLHADARLPNAFSAAQLLPLQVLADQAAAVVEQTRLLAEAQAHVRRLAVAQRVSALVNDSADLDTLLRRLLMEAVALVNCRRGMIALVDPDRRHVRGRVSMGLPEGVMSATVRRLYAEPHPDEDVYALGVRSGEQFIYGDDHPGRHRPTAERFGLRYGSRVMTPIRHAGEVIGVVTIGLADREPNADDLAVLRLVAEQAGGAVACSRLAEGERAAAAEAREAHAELRTMLDRLAISLKSSGTVLITYDLDCRVRSIQGDVEAMFGWPVQELLGRLATDFVFPAGRTEAVELFQRRCAEGFPPVRYESVLLHRSGRPVPVLIASGPLQEDGRLVGAAAAVTDISALKQLQEERDAAWAERARVEGAIRTGRTVAHALGSPLGIILGLADLLAEDARLPADVGADLALLRRQAMRAGALLQQFGSIARYEEIVTPIGPQLDLNRASAPAGDSETT